MHHPEQTNSIKLGDEVLLETRESMTDVTAYLEDVVDRLTILKYDIEDVFDADEAFEFLNADLPDGVDQNAKEVFIHDIIHWANVFFRQTLHAKMRLQLLPVRNNMCRLFHEDNYRQRLLCTYLGSATEWLNHDNVNRSKLGKGANELIVKDATQINRAKTFDVILLKGARCESGLGVVHRSPPLENNQHVRVLLKIDEW